MGRTPVCSGPYARVAVVAARQQIGQEVYLGCINKP